MSRSIYLFIYLFIYLLLYYLFILYYLFVIYYYIILYIYYIIYLLLLLIYLLTNRSNLASNAVQKSVQNQELHSVNIVYAACSDVGESKFHLNRKGMNWIDIQLK